MLLLFVSSGLISIVSGDVFSAMYIKAKDDGNGLGACNNDFDALEAGWKEATAMAEAAITAIQTVQKGKNNFFGATRPIAKTVQALYGIKVAGLVGGMSSADKKILDYALSKR